MKTICFFLSIWIASGAAGQIFAQQEMEGKVIGVTDGNTIEVQVANQKEIFFLADIDAPELSQEYGEKAKRFLEKLIIEKGVTIQIQGKDRKGNYLAIVLIKKGNVDPRIELLKEGLAWTSEKNPSPKLEIHRATAQEKGRGLWKQDNPVPPWIHRRQQSMLQAKSSS